MMKILEGVLAEHSVRIYMNSSEIMEIQVSVFDVYGESRISELDKFVG